MTKWEVVMWSDDATRERFFTFRKIFQHRQHWRALIEYRNMPDTITTPTGEEICYYDLMDGIDTLPPRQFQAFSLVCLFGYTESAARDVMMSGSQSEALVGHYATAGLKNVIKHYDAKGAS